MKHVIIALCTLFCLQLWANDPVQKQKVYSIVKQYRSADWYAGQLQLWRQETLQHPKNAAAWLNVYTATRMLKLLQVSETQADLDAVVEQIKKNIPNTFECYYIQSWNGGDDPEFVDYLLKAYELDPNRPETYSGFVNSCEITRDKVNEQDFCTKWFASNDISAGLYAWNYNLLMSCDKDAILITNGDNDTYPALILQHAKDIRKDVTVLNTSLLTRQDYREACFKEMGIPLYKPVSEKEDFTQMVQHICAHIRKNTGRPFYYAGTVNPELYNDVKDNLYTVGLAFKYAKASFDNIAVLRKNYEKNFVKDYLKVTLTTDISQSVVDQMNGAYLTPLLILRRHYQDAGETQALDNITTLIKLIAERSGQAAEVNQIINQDK